MRTTTDKIGVREGSRAIFVNAPHDALSGIDQSRFRVSSRLSGKFEYIHFFVTMQTTLDRRFPTLKKHLAVEGALWISWPKSGMRKKNLNLKDIIRIGYRHGLVESKTISIDETWSAIKFTHPVKGRVYRNSYGTLPQDLQ